MGGEKEREHKCSWANQQSKRSEGEVQATVGA